ncbi:unnamed protein product [Hydatigera taeniaeformis]|uniref:Protein kinase domain-containing protein n=1 Tax=Hydatigena taeniaeformis TaxID=6205 RepID=A0A0R3XC72_HYDTA|nr:unnamed protein product [Hydatigera taeniaeformis]
MNTQERPHPARQQPPAPPPVGWNIVADSPYQNLSTDKGPENSTGGRLASEVEEAPGLPNPSQVHFGAPYTGSGKSGLTQSLQREGEFIPQRGNDLMADSGMDGGGDLHSVTSSGTEYKQATNGYFALKTFRKVDLVREHCTDCMRIEKRVLQLVTEARHPCFVHMIACFQPQDYAVIVLDYLPGGDLMQHIQSGPFDEERTVFYAACVVLALEFLHLNNIMYRDLKLENLLLTGYGYLKVVDFGLCKANMGPNDKTSTFCGTPQFVAPEMITDTGYTRAIDWWCLGVLIYEMLVGKSCDPPNCEVTHSWGRDPSQRLGVSAGGIMDIKRHSFFADLNFDALLANRIKPPFIPKLVGHFLSIPPPLPFEGTSAKQIR